MIMQSTVRNLVPADLAVPGVNVEISSLRHSIVIGTGSTINTAIFDVNVYRRRKSDPRRVGPPGTRIIISSLVQTMLEFAPVLRG